MLLNKWRNDASCTFFAFSQLQKWYRSIAGIAFFYTHIREKNIHRVNYKNFPHRKLKIVRYKFYSLASLSHLKVTHKKKPCAFRVSLAGFGGTGERESFLFIERLRFGFCNSEYWLCRFSSGQTLAEFYILFQLCYLERRNRRQLNQRQVSCNRILPHHKLFFKAATVM